MATSSSSARSPGCSETGRQLLRRTDIVGTLVDGLRAVDQDTRLRAVEVLGGLGGRQATEGLAAALSDSSTTVRCRAIFHLGQLGDVRSRQALQEVSESDQLAYVVRAARRAVGLIDAWTREANGSSNGHCAEARPHPLDM